MKYGLKGAVIETGVDKKGEAVLLNKSSTIANVDRSVLKAAKSVGRNIGGEGGDSRNRKV